MARAILSNRSTLSEVGGWVLKILLARPLFFGSDIHIPSRAESLPKSSGAEATPDSNFLKALASARGLPVILAPVSSARNSRLREIAICISRAAIGTAIIMIMPTRRISPLLPFLSLPPERPMKNTILEAKVRMAAMVEATAMTRMSRFFTCDIS